MIIPLTQWPIHMMTSSNGNIFHVTGPVNSPHKGQWCGTLLFSLICTRINGYTNTREAGDMRRHRHYSSLITFNYFFLDGPIGNKLRLVQLMVWHHWRPSSMQLLTNATSGVTGKINDDVIKWKCFRVTGPLWGIHRWPVDSPYEGPLTRPLILYMMSV